MEQLKWTTVSSWVDETLELFSYIDEDINLDILLMKVKNGEIYGDRKENSAIRVFQSIKARYLCNDDDTIIALSNIINSNISYQEKCNYLLIFYLEYETLAKLFLEEYVYNNFNNYGQKIFTEMDINKFFEIVLNEYSGQLPEKLRNGISKASMQKVKNNLWKNIENFGWIDSSDGKINIKRPKLTPEWFVFTLYLYFEETCIDTVKVYNSSVYKRFLLNEYDIEYLITGAKLKNLIHTENLGHINTITKHEKGLKAYAKNYK